MRVSAVRFLFDEDCNGRIVRGVRRRAPTLETVTALEAGLSEAADDAVLQRAASESRVVISHDYRTMRARAEDRLRAGLPMAGLILAPQDVQLGKVIEELVLIAETTSPEEWQGQILFLPL
jgi:predicted nuclease of predicted toxin-antitoxin system